MNYLTEFNRTPDPLKITIHINYFQIWDLGFGLLIFSFSPESLNNNINISIFLMFTLFIVMKVQIFFLLTFLLFKDESKM